MLVACFSFFLSLSFSFVCFFFECRTPNTVPNRVLVQAAGYRLPALCLFTNVRTNTISSQQVSKVILFHCLPNGYTKHFVVNSIGLFTYIFFSLQLLLVFFVIAFFHILFHTFYLHNKHTHNKRAHTHTHV